MAKADGEFRVGDTVLLKSGGPSMTVTAVLDDVLFCNAVWFDESDHIHSSCLPIAALLHEEEDEG